jgi:hypothetical protein
MNPAQIPDGDWFETNTNRMYRVRERGVSDPKSQGIWPFRICSRYVIVKRKWGGGFQVIPAPAQIDLIDDPAQMADWNYDSVLSACVTGPNSSVTVNRKKHIGVTDPQIMLSIYATNSGVTK